MRSQRILLTEFAHHVPADDADHRRVGTVRQIVVDGKVDVLAYLLDGRVVDKLTRSRASLLATAYSIERVDRPLGRMDLNAVDVLGVNAIIDQCLGRRDGRVCSNNTDRPSHRCLHNARPSGHLSRTRRAR